MDTKKYLAAVASTGLLAAAAVGLSTPAYAASDDCSALTGLTIDASLFGLPTTGAVLQDVQHLTDPTGYCQVKGHILPVDPEAEGVHFQVNLPDEWNGRTLQMGGGGLDGSLVTGLGSYAMQANGDPSALAQGYVTLGSDGGHTASGAWDAEFGFNEESLRDFGDMSIKKTHDAAAAVIAAFYQRDAEFNYFIGGSQGGHEALDAAARYSEDYDGVVANYPAYNVMMLHMASLNIGRGFYENGGASWLSPDETRMLVDIVYDTCDTVELDGAKDGIISNIAGCNEVLTVDSLKASHGCEGGGPGDGCFSDDQIEAIRNAATPYQPGFEIAGMTQFERWPILEGAIWTRSTFGDSPVPSNPLSGGEGLLYTIGSINAKYFVTQDPLTDGMTFDPKEWEGRIQYLATFMDNSNVSLQPFFDKGGKLILLHGTADDFISPHNSEDYWQMRIDDVGADTLAESARYYVIPGLGHGAGPFNAKYDGLGAISDWVENGQAPQNMVAVDGDNPDRSRPMCEYGTWQHYTGGPVNEASSFTCSSGPVTGPEGEGIPLTADVPALGGGGGNGSLTLSVADFGESVNLGAALNAGDRFRFQTKLPTVTVTDTRSADQAGAGGWSVTGQGTTLTGDAGAIEASNLGWVPGVPGLRPGITVGAPVRGIMSGGPGLAVPAMMATATGDARLGSTNLGADLVLEVPVDTAQGTYDGHLTVSVFPVD